MAILDGGAEGKLLKVQLRAWRGTKATEDAAQECLLAEESHSFDTIDPIDEAVERQMHEDHLLEEERAAAGKLYLETLDLDCDTG